MISALTQALNCIEMIVNYQLSCMQIIQVQFKKFITHYKCNKKQTISGINFKLATAQSWIMS